MFNVQTRGLKQSDCFREPSSTPSVTEEKDGTCVIQKKNGAVRHCDFPWTKPGWKVFNSCQDAVDRRGQPHCWTREEVWDLCPENSIDPDCEFELPAPATEIAPE